MGPKRFLPERKSYSGLEKFVAGRGINWDEWDEDKHAQEVETEFHRILHVVKFPEAAEDEAAQAADMKRVWHAHAGGFAWPNSNASWEKKVLLVDLWSRLAADFAGTMGGDPLVHSAQEDDGDGLVLTGAGTVAPLLPPGTPPPPPPPPPPRPPPPLDHKDDTGLDLDGVLDKLYDQSKSSVGVDR